MTDFVAPLSGRSLLARLLTLAVASGCATAAFGGRPLQADDAGVLDRGTCEIEAYTASLRGAEGKERERTLQTGCGIGARSQVALAAARSRSDDGSASRLQLGGKTRLWVAGSDAQTDHVPMLTLAYALGWGREENRVWRHSASALNLVYSTPLGSGPDRPLTLHANLGHAREKNGPVRHSTTWVLALEHAGHGRFAPMAELFGDDRDGAWWNLGIRATALPDKAYVDLSYGRKLRSSSERLVTLGLKVVFGAE